MIFRLFATAVLAAGLGAPGAFAALPAPPASPAEAAPMPSLAPIV